MENKKRLYENRISGILIKMLINSKIRITLQINKHATVIYYLCLMFVWDRGSWVN